MNQVMVKFYLFLGGVAVAFLLLVNALFTVNQRQFAVVFQFGEALRTINAPGLQIKVPFIQKVEFFDKRILNVDAEAKELTASDGKRVIVDAFAKFKITNPVVFYKTVYNYQGVRIRLNKILESSMRKVIGRVPFITLLTGERANVMVQIRDQVNEEVQAFGLTIVDVRILRADLPKENSAAIYRSMQTEREKEAKQIRAEGQEEAARIRSKADKESQILLADAYMQSQILKGDGDGEAAMIYNKAYGEDQEFYKFYKSLSVYRETMKNSDTSFVLPADAEFLKYLKLSK